MPSAYPGALDALPTTSANSTPAEDTHPALHNDANAAINAVQSTLGVNPQGSELTVADRLDAIEATAGGLIRCDVFNVSGSPHTWAKAVGVKWIRVVAIGGGGGGGGAGLGPATRRDLPGQGAGGGAIVMADFPASAFSPSEIITVGTGGAGGSGGANGASGVASTIGSKVTAAGGAAGLRGGQSISDTSGVISYIYGALTTSNPGIATGGGSGVASSTYDMPCGGGAGGAGLGGNNGGAGGAMRTLNITARNQWNTVFPSWTHTLLQAGGGAGNASGAPSNGGAGQTIAGMFGGGGGGGGGTNTTNNGGAGGAGGLYGGGGGGGGGNNDSGGTGGAGGNGGDGLVVIWQFG